MEWIRLEVLALAQSVAAPPRGKAGDSVDTSEPLLKTHSQKLDCTVFRAVWCNMFAWEEETVDEVRLLRYNLGKRMSSEAAPGYTRDGHQRRH